MTQRLQAVLSPRSIAVVGVSSRPESLSGRLLDNLLAFGYAGRVYPVNPKADEIRSLRSYPTVTAIPERVDLAVLMVPRHVAMAAVEDCIEADVGGVVVITAGFREGGEDGARLERDLVQRLRDAGIPMVGPNCMGLINTDSTVRLDATFSPVRAMPGSVAFASHSGALGVAVLEAAGDAGLGFSRFVSLGNSADVRVTDILEAWEDDGGTRSVMLYLEAIEEPRRFLEVASRMTREKPVVALKAGRTSAGQKAASSHTGALAAADTAVDALLRQAGVIRAGSLAELFDVAVASQLAVLPEGPRVAVVTNAGGPAIVAMDALVDHGLEPAAIAEGTAAALRDMLPDEAGVGNPTDMLPSARDTDYGRAVELVAADDGVDAVVVIVVTPILVTPHQVAEALARAASAAGKPVLTVFMTAPSFHGEARSIAGMPPIYRYPESAVRALAALVRHGRRAAALATTPADRLAPPRVESRLLAAAAAAGREGYLTPAEAFTVLEEIGIEVAPWRVVGDTGAAVSAAGEIGYPVVLKAVGADLVHKTEVGAVAVGLGSDEELAREAVAMQERLAAAGVTPDGFMVQGMVSGGREVILGLTRDPAVGPLVMCGTGGVAVEVWKDVSFRVAPVGDAEAGVMLDELGGKALLGAFRGRRPGDLAALRNAVARLSAMGAAHPEVAECDINPLLVLDEGAGCVAVDVRIRLEAPSSGS